MSDQSADYVRGEARVEAHQPDHGMWQMKDRYLTRPEPYDPGEFQGILRREYAWTERGAGPVYGYCSFCPEPAHWMAFTETLKTRKPTAYALCERHVRTKWWVR